MCARCVRVLLDGCPLGHSDHTVRLCLFPFAALALYCALLCTLLLIAEQICIALEHARGFVAVDLHAIVHRTASFPYLMRSTPPKVVEDSSDVLWLQLAAACTALCTRKLPPFLSTQLVPLRINFHCCARSQHYRGLDCSPHR